MFVQLAALLAMTAVALTFYFFARRSGVGLYGQG
jgi:hypothetical protein